LAFGKSRVRVDDATISSENDRVIERPADKTATYRVLRDAKRVAIFENAELVLLRKNDGNLGLGNGEFTSIRTCVDTIPPKTRAPCHQLAPDECVAPCIWHGDQIGCRRALYCKLPQPNQCHRSPACRWTKRGCVRK
jgi:hypothetical protein